MSTPTNQQSGQAKKPAPKPGQAAPQNKTPATKNTPAASKPAQTTPRATQNAAQNAAKTPQAAGKTASQSTPKTAAPAPRATTAPAPRTPPAPKPRDPSVVRRDERREERRLEIQARQQERRLELRQAKRQKLLIRYDLIIAPILLIALVALFLVLHLPIEAIVSGIVILFAGFTVLAYAAVGMPTSQSRRLARPGPSALPEAEVVDSTIHADAQTATAEKPAEAENQPAPEAQP